MVAEATKKKPRLLTIHFFPFTRMVRAMGGKALLSEIMRLRKEASKRGQAEEAEGFGEELGMELMGILLDRLPDAENETLDFLALFMGISREELEQQPIDETINALVELVRDANFLDFLRSAVKGTRQSS